MNDSLHVVNSSRIFTLDFYNAMRYLNEEEGGTWEHR